MSALPTKDDFAAQVNTVFRQRVGAEQVFAITLTSCKDKILTPAQHCFVLVFRAPVEAPPEQGVYPVEHDTLGNFALFLVPFAKDESGLYYEAVFNLLIS